MSTISTEHLQEILDHAQEDCFICEPRVVDASQVKGHRQDVDGEFIDHEFIDQQGPGFAGDDYSGTMYLPLSSGTYLAQSYARRVGEAVS